MADIIVDAVKFGLGFIYADRSGAASDVADQIETDMADAIVSATDIYDSTKAANELKGKAAKEAYDLSVATYEQNYLTNLSANVQKQGENRRRTNVEAVNAEQQGLLTGGGLTASLAGSGVRNTGSAKNLRSENTRLTDVGVEEMDATLAGQEAGFGIQRTGLKEKRDTNIAGAGLTYEHTAESIVDRDLTLTDGVLDYAERDLENGVSRVDEDGNPVEGIDFGDTVLTRELGRDLDWLQLQSDNWYNNSERLLGYDVTGREAFEYDYKKNYGADFL